MPPLQLPNDQTDQNPAGTPANRYAGATNLWASALNAHANMLDELETDLAGKADIAAVSVMPIAVTGIIPTAAQNGRYSGGELVWTILDGTPDGYFTSPSRAILGIQDRADPGLGFLGLKFYGAQRSGTAGSYTYDRHDAGIFYNVGDTDERNLPFGTGFGTGLATQPILQINAQYEPDRNNWQVELRGLGATIPANSVALAYAIFTGQGPQGPPGENNRIEPVATLPDADTRPLGEVRATTAGVFSNQDRAGEPNEIADDVSLVVANQYHIVSDGNEFTWWTGASAGAGGVLAQLFLSKSYNRTAPAGPFYVRAFQNDGTQVNLGAFSRAMGADTATGWAYQQTTTRFSENTGSVRVAVYSDTNYGTQQKIRSANAWVQVTGATGGGLSQAEVDARIDARRPNPFTNADETKLDGIENNATADQTPAEIVTGLEGLTGGDRLSASAVRGIEDGLSEKHQEIVDSFSGGTYTQSTPDAQIGEVRSSSSGSTIPTGIAWGITTLTQAGQISNGWVQLRILKADKDDLASFRLVVGQTNYPATSWRFVADSAPAQIWAYYEQQVPTIADGTVLIVERKQRLRMDEDVRIGTLPAVHPSYYGTEDSADDIGYHLLEGYSVAGTDNRIPLSRLPFEDETLHTGATANFQITTTQVSNRQPLQLFSPAFDLDDTDNQTGVFALQSTLGFASRTSTAIGWTQAQAPVVVTAMLSGRAFATALRASSVYAAAGTRQGLEIWSQTIWHGTTSLGVLRLVLARNAANQVGFYFDWTGASGNQTIVVTQSLEARFTHNEAGTGGGGTGLNQAAVDARIAAYGRPFTQADETKLDGVETRATADQTGAEIVTRLSGLSGNARLPASAVRDIPSATGGGLNQAAVDARIKDYARTGSTIAIPDDAFTRKHDEIIDAFDGAGPAANITLGQLSRARSARPTSGNAATLTYGLTSYEQSPRVTSWWIPLRIRTTEKANLAQWQVALITGEGNVFASYKGTNWTFIRDATVWSYYAVQAADLPVGITPTIEKFEPFRLDADKVTLGPAGGRTLIATATGISGVINRNVGWQVVADAPVFVYTLSSALVFRNPPPDGVIGLWIEAVSAGVPVTTSAGRLFVPYGQYIQAATTTAGNLYFSKSQGTIGTRMRVEADQFDARIPGTRTDELCWGITIQGTGSSFTVPTPSIRVYTQSV